MRNRTRNVGLFLAAVFAAVTAGAGAQTIPEGPLALGNGRFEVSMSWQSTTGTGAGHPVQLTPDAGYFWFFDPSNVEILVKVIDACETYGYQWVFAGGLTDVGVAMTVTDRHTGISKSYINTTGTPFLPIQDTHTFVSACSAEPPPPPPPAYGPLTGTWTGTFDSVKSGPGDYDCSPSVPAHASFRQVGSAVEGTIWAATAEPGGCGANNVIFHGTFDGYALQGTLIGGGPRYGFSPGSTAYGDVSSGTTLKLILRNSGPDPETLIPGGTLLLRLAGPEER